MKIVSLVFFILILITTCTVKTSEYSKVNKYYYSENTKCNKLLKTISNKWRFHNKFKTCYQYNEKLVFSIVDQKECFCEFNQDEIIKLFGRPTLTYKNVVKYNMSQNCEEIDTFFSMYSLYFEFEHQKTKQVYSLEATTLY